MPVKQGNQVKNGQSWLDPSPAVQLHFLLPFVQLLFVFWQQQKHFYQLILWLISFKAVTMNQLDMKSVLPASEFEYVLVS